MRHFILFILILTGTVKGQDILVEPGKNINWESHKTFRFGKSEIVTHKEDKKISDASLDKIIRETIERELKLKGIQAGNESATLIITYLAGSFHHSEIQRLGPAGVAPGMPATNLTRDFDQGSLVIDVNDASNGSLVWRVNSTVTTNIPDPRNSIEQVVARGFKKFGPSLKKKKRN